MHERDVEIGLSQPFFHASSLHVLLVSRLSFLAYSYSYTLFYKHCHTNIITIMTNPAVVEIMVLLIGVDTFP